MDEFEDPKNVDVEMPEYGLLLGEHSVQQPSRRQKPPKNWYPPERLLWAIGILVCLVLLSDNVRLRQKQKFRTAFDTDMIAAKHTSELIEYHFTGGLELDHEGRLYRQVNPLEPQYAGEPSPEIDKAWDDLLSAVDLSFDTKDLHGLEKTSVHINGGKAILISLDVYHSLHCLDMVRKAIDFRYYFPTGKVPYFYRSHLDHCVDYLRQALQCQSDLTPLTYVKTGLKNRTIPVFGTPHTCRNFSKVHEWALEKRVRREAA